MLLPALIFGAEVEGARVLQVRRQHDRLVSSFTRQLNPQVPGIQGDKRKLQVVSEEVFLCELIKPVDGFAESARVLDMLPGERRQARCGESVWATQ